MYLRQNRPEFNNTHDGAGEMNLNLSISLIGSFK